MTNRIAEGWGWGFLTVLHGPLKFVCSLNAACDENVLLIPFGNNQMNLIWDIWYILWTFETPIVAITHKTPLTDLLLTPLPWGKNDLVETVRLQSSRGWITTTLMPITNEDTRYALKRQATEKAVEDLWQRVWASGHFLVNCNFWAPVWCPARSKDTFGLSKEKLTFL